MRNAFFLFAINLFFAACQNPTPSVVPVPVATITFPNNPVAISPNTATPLTEGTIWTDTSFSQSNNTFALNLFLSLYKNNKQNQIMSPYSISTAMGMVFLGSAGDSEKEIGTVFQWGKNTQNLHKTFAKQQEFIKNLQKDSVTLGLANRIWVKSPTQLTQQYVNEVQQYYNVLLQSFKDSEIKETVNYINTWVESQTNNKIHDLVNEEIVEQAAMLLVNAIYFYGAWQTPFDKNSTNDNAFTLADGSEITIPFMYKKETVSYFEDEKIQAAEIPYKGATVSLFVVLPKENYSLEALLSGLTIKNYLSWIENITPMELHISLPKWKSETTILLPKTLEKMGMPKSFTDAADFSRMTGDKSLYIGTAIHKAMIDVSEQGTEAAASTVISMTKESSAGMSKVFNANRPFLYFIKENKTNAILFMGQVYNPKM